jgi:hypothetical protein
VDRTLINIASILVGGAGLFSILAGYNVPEVDRSFFGPDPFLVKQGAIAEVSDSIFAIVTVAALLLQLCAEVIGDAVPHRIHGSAFYVGAGLVGLAAVALLVRILSRLAGAIARLRWLPQVIQLQADLFDRCEFIVANGGLDRKQLAEPETMSEALREEFRRRHLEFAEQYTVELARLLEVDPRGDLRDRIKRLRALFRARAP